MANTSKLEKLRKQLAEEEAKANAAKAKTKGVYTFVKVERKGSDILAYVAGREEPYTLSAFAAALAEAMSKGLKLV